MKVFAICRSPGRHSLNHHPSIQGDLCLCSLCISDNNKLHDVMLGEIFYLCHIPKSREKSLIREVLCSVKSSGIILFRCAHIQPHDGVWWWCWGFNERIRKSLFHPFSGLTRFPQRYVLITKRNYVYYSTCSISLASIQSFVSLFPVVCIVIILSTHRLPSKNRVPQCMTVLAVKRNDLTPEMMNHVQSTEYKGNRLWK